MKLKAYKGAHVMITDKILEDIYEKVKTPYKYGAVIKEDGFLTDSPVVFSHKGRFYMSYINIDSKKKTGYKTYLAVSDDLVHFETLGQILTENNAWDVNQTGGYAQFIDNAFGAGNEVRKVGGQYAFAYIGGSRCGYESDPLSMGMAFCDEITDLSSYRKLNAPVLSGSDADAREGEKLTIYKADMFEDEKQSLGHRYVCAYNAKNETHRESIFLAVSDDGKRWKRYGAKPIIDVRECPDDLQINGDPQIVTIDGLYVMFYFVYQSGKTFNTFAVSEDLTDWKKWNGAPLIESEYEWENAMAHKQWFLKHDGTVFQYYCAVNSRGERFIALATSKKI